MKYPIKKMSAKVEKNQIKENMMYAEDRWLRVTDHGSFTPDYMNSKQRIRILIPSTDYIEINVFNKMLLIFTWKTLANFRSSYVQQ